MIVMELYQERPGEDGLYRTYSDRGMMIERDGILYDEAIDPGNLGRIYTETETPVPVPEPEEAPEAGQTDSEVIS